jgi:NADH dehydrogenase
MSQVPGTKPRIVVVGGGFGGLYATRGLSRLPVLVTVVDRKNHHTFQPLLYQVALAVLSPAEISAPIRNIFRGKGNVDVRMDEVTGFDLEAKQVRMHHSGPLNYDYLVLATGATHSYFGHEEWSEAAPGLKSLEDATEIRRRVLLAFELAEREAAQTGTVRPLNFVVIGAGPTGVELAGAIAEIARKVLIKDFRAINPASARVVLLEGGPRVLAAYPEDLSASAQKQLERLGVEVHTSAQVTNVEPGAVFAGDERIPASVVMWAAGVKASPLGEALGAPLDRRGCVIVDEYLNIPGHSEVFVIGDLAHRDQDGKQLPGVSPTAIQMGQYLRRAVAADFAGKPRPAFHYIDKGSMATIGKSKAVADVFGLHLSGLPAWLAWLLIHLLYLIGFRNRMLVVMQWAWAYIANGSGVRLITGSDELPGWKSSSQERHGDTK